MAAGAVLGTGFTFEQLVRVADLEEGEGLFALDEALASRLVREADPTNDGYAFSHDKVRDVAYTEAGPARRRVFHRRALAALEEEEAPAAWLARHALAAGMTEAAFGHLLAAGDAAMAVFAADDAIGYYERARGLLGGPGKQRGSRVSLPTTEIEHLHANLGRARELAGEWEEAQSTYEEMLSRARETGDHRLECVALNHLALVAQRRYDMGRAKELLRESLGAAEASGERAMVAETEWNLAQMAVMKWEPETALSCGERVLDLARELSLDELEARSLYVLCLAHTFAGRWGECGTYASQAAALYRALGDKPTDVGPLAAQFIWSGTPPSKELANRAMESLSLCQLTLGEVCRGSPRAAVEAGRRASRVGREIDNDWAHSPSKWCLGHGLLETGEYGEALRLARQYLEMVRKIQYPLGNFAAHTILGNMLLAVLGLEESLEEYLKSLAAADAIPVRPWKLLVVPKLCANRALAGDWEAAHRYASEAVEIRNAAPTRLMHLDFYRHHETEALLKGGEERPAREDARHLGERVGQNRRYHLVHLRMLAVLDRRDGRTEGALARLQEAEALAEEIGLPGELWQTRAALGELHEESGDEERAGPAFSRAAQTLRTLAGQIDDPKLREGFLSAPQVRRVLERDGSGHSVPGPLHPGR